MHREREKNNMLISRELSEVGRKTQEDVWYSLQEILNRSFFSMLQLDLRKGTACILQSVDFPEHVAKEVMWEEYLRGYERFISAEELEAFRLESLRERCRTGQSSFSKDIAYEVGDVREWLTIEILLHCGGGHGMATATVRKSSEVHLLKRIIDLYVYNTCDYFIYLDAKNNSYTMFSATGNGTPLPSVECEDYAAEVADYVGKFVVPEDRKRVAFEMGLDRVLERLRQVKKHSVGCGILDPIRGYTRKRLEFRYYDLKNQMILLSCTDTTETYMEEQEKQKALQEALECARTDSLTGLLNRQGIVEAIESGLEEKGEGLTALLVLDLDNFKKVNDTLGHLEGDRLLCRVADLLRSESGDGDSAGRMGGDEFLVFLRSCKSAEEVRAYAQRLCDGVSKLSAVTGLTTGCSIGAAFAEKGMDSFTLMKKADSRAYAAKYLGKNRVVVN